MIRTVIQQMRIRQWTKNFVVFAGVIFAHEFLDPVELARAASGFLSFCLLASAVYALNDLIDLPFDRVHPKKRSRPLPSGRISPAGAVVLLVLLAGTGGAIALFLGTGFAAIAGGYLLLNVAYTLRLKRVVMLDVLAISIGFVLRAVAGVALLTEPVSLSPWLLLCTFFLALFLAVSKRRHERTLLQDQAELHRKTLAEYPPELVDQMIPVVTAATVISYSIYTVAPGTIERVGGADLVYTVPFVIFGVFRYLYVVFRKLEGGSPSETLLTDAPTLVNVLLWLSCVLYILYIPR
ncbi:MAG: decaprenyl-phosphate phosphoribosyltransferase [Candidatus Eisenbacteria bacterium]|nr:decaprenyl-phosphate phosphoribosyltransferase [Candidatus Latescibacterota bacterium]MBD3301092.1 decaprenyl-phosphate phosphoribosyltransferase [Candidatus Eisenbacteria bacterium]